MTQRQTATYDSSIKAQVIADYQSGSSANALAVRYDIPRTTIRQWTNRAGPPRLAGEIKAQLDAEVIKLVFSSIRTLRAILRHSRKSEWLEKQDAHSLGVYYGITADKLTAVLAAVERGQEIQEANDALESSRLSDSNE